MPDRVSDRNVAKLQSSARLAAVAVGAWCGLNLVGWAFDVAQLTSVVPGFAPMSVPTSISLALVSASLFAMSTPAPSRGARLLAHGCALCVFAFGAHTLGTYALGRADAGDLLGPGLGRVSPATATIFILLAATLADHDRRWARLTVGLATLGLVISALALVGYAYGVDALYRVMPFSAMALPTALASAALFLGALLARPRHGWIALLARSDAGGQAARRLLPAVVGVPFGLSWIIVEVRDLGLLATPFGIASCWAASSVWCRRGSPRRMSRSRAPVR